MRLLGLITTLVLQHAIPIGLYLLAGYLAFSKNKIVERIEAVKLPKEPQTKSRAVLQVIIIATFFAIVLSIINIVISHGLDFRKIILFVTWLIILIFTSGILHQTALNSLARNTISVSFATILSYSWYAYPNWLTIDTTTLILVIQFLLTFRNISIKQSALIACGIMIYDAFMVFGTGVMQKVAGEAISNGKVLMPILIMIPQSLSLESKAIFVEGLGDVVLPGLVVMCAMRESIRLSMPTLTMGACAGYIMGSLISLMVLIVFNFPQPATIYLMPGVFVGLLSVAWHKRLIKKVFVLKPASN